MEEKKKELPKLVKQQSVYRMVVPRNVEEKIRYLLRKFPSTEWSGVLFYTHEGTFENNDLVITCKDIYPMDLGNATFTSFSMNEDVAGYMAENMELFDGSIGLIHSHHCMQSSFSGTDTSTLQKEGSDTNCFVSLIVNNAGTYNAAVTRRVKSNVELTIDNLGKTYEFFGDGEVALSDKGPREKRTLSQDTIEYFMLNVEREEVTNSLSYLDARFDEIAKSKSRNTAKAQPITLNKDDEPAFFDWMHKKEKEPKKELPLFDDDVYTELKDTSLWKPDKEIIHTLSSRLLTGDVLFKDSEMFSLQKWVDVHMKSAYADMSTSQLEAWADFAVEYLIDDYDISYVPDDVLIDWDQFASKVTSAMYEEISELRTPNDEVYKIIKIYMDKLARYIYE